MRKASYSISCHAAVYTIVSICQYDSTDREKLQYSSDFSCGVHLDKVYEKSPGGLDFSAFDLSRLSLSPFGKGSVTLPDPTRGWLEKQVAIYSDAYCSPIAIRRIHYRYKIKGRIK